MHLMVETMRDCVDRHTDFSIETPLAYQSYVDPLRDWQPKG